MGCICADSTTATFAFSKRVTQCWSFRFSWKEERTQSTAASIPEIVWVLLCRDLLSYSSSPEASVRPKTVPFLNVLLSRWLWMQIWMYYQAAILSKLQRTLSYWVNAVLMAVSRTVHLVGHSSFKVVIGSSWLSVVVVMSANMPFEFPWLTKEHT